MSFFPPVPFQLETLKAYLTLAGLEASKFEPLKDGYTYDPRDSRYYDEAPRTCWWMFKTKAGWVKIGPRARVMHLEWTDTPLRFIPTTREVTHGDDYVHAYNETELIEYLRLLADRIKEVTASAA